MRKKTEKMKIQVSGQKGKINQDIGPLDNKNSTKIPKEPTEREGVDSIVTKLLT